MIAKNENLLAKIGKMMKLGFGTALILCAMLVFSAQEASAQSLVQGTAAITKLKPRIKQLQNVNCVLAAPSGTTTEIANKANQLRCEFYTDVYTSFSGGAKQASSNPVPTAQAINDSYNRLIAKYPGAVAKAAADLLKNEITDFLKS